MTKRGKKSGEWMTIAEAVKHIMKTQGIGQEAAVKQVEDAVRSGKLDLYEIPARQPK